MNARMRGVALGSILILGASCSRTPESAAAGIHATTPVDRAVAVARAIRADPAAADSILAAHGLTRSGLDSLMYDIAADSTLARVYSEANR